MLLEGARVFFNHPDQFLVQWRCGALHSIVSVLRLADLIQRSRINLLDQIVLLGVLLELVAHSAHNVLDLGPEELLERVDRDGGHAARLPLLDFLLLIEDDDDLGVVVPVLPRALPVVQIYQHVSQVLVQSCFDMLRNVVVVIIVLLLLTLLGRLLVLLGMSFVLMRLRRRLTIAALYSVCICFLLLPWLRLLLLGRPGGGV